MEKPTLTGGDGVTEIGSYRVETVEGKIRLQVLRKDQSIAFSMLISHESATSLVAVLLQQISKEEQKRKEEAAQQARYRENFYRPGAWA